MGCENPDTHSVHKHAKMQPKMLFEANPKIKKLIAKSIELFVALMEGNIREKSVSRIRKGINKDFMIF